jgi:hypothetical protein
MDQVLHNRTTERMTEKDSIVRMSRIPIVGIRIPLPTNYSEQKNIIDAFISDNKITI